MQTPWTRILLCILALFSVACGGGNAAPPSHELQRTTSGNIVVVLLADHDEVKQGRDTLSLEFRGADGTLKDVGTVRVNATMSMAGMAPMLGTIEIARTSTPGRYAVSTDLGMSGGWQLNVEWDGPVGRGTARLQQTVR